MFDQLCYLTPNSSSYKVILPGQKQKESFLKVTNCYQILLLSLNHDSTKSVKSNKRTLSKHTFPFVKIKIPNTFAPLIMLTSLWQYSFLKYVEVTLSGSSKSELKRQDGLIRET